MSGTGVPDLRYYALTRPERSMPTPLRDVGMPPYSRLLAAKLLCAADHLHELGAVAVRIIAGGAGGELLDGGKVQVSTVR